MQTEYEEKSKKYQERCAQSKTGKAPGHKPKAPGHKSLDKLKANTTDRLVGNSWQHFDYRGGA